MRSLGVFEKPTSESKQDIEQTTLRLLLHRPSAIHRFEVLVGK